MGKLLLKLLKILSRYNYCSKIIECNEENKI